MREPRLCSRARVAACTGPLTLLSGQPCLHDASGMPQTVSGHCPLEQSPVVELQVLQHAWGLKSWLVLTSPTANSQRCGQVGFDALCSEAIQANMH